MSMDLADLLAKDGIVPDLTAQDKKQALQLLAQKAQEITGLAQHDIFNALLQRERLSSTSLGRGIAIPHVKMAGLASITCLFAKLSNPEFMARAKPEAIEESRERKQELDVLVVRLKSALSRIEA